MKNNPFKKVFIFLFALLLGIPFVKAHCPLCTLGAVAAAGGAAYFGVNNLVIGLFIGAFAVSMGWWISNLIKKKFIPFQKTLLVIFSFLTTILPLLPLPVFHEAKGIYLSQFGPYGYTIALNTFLMGSILGGLIICITPWLSHKITEIRNGKLIPYQGIILTLGLLLITGTTMQLLL